MKTEIADILSKKVKDPRIGFATITEVTVTPDFRHAWVYVTILEDQATTKETLKGLGKASGFIRSELGRRLRLRRIPDITFQCDDHTSKTQQVLNILDTLSSPQNPTPSPSMSTDGNSENAPVSKRVKLIPVNGN